MPIIATELEGMLKSAFPDAVITVTDLAGDNDHFQVKIKSQAFRGKSRVMQHKAVYEALQGKAGGDIHALSIITEAA